MMCLTHKPDALILLPTKSEFLSNQGGHLMLVSGPIQWIGGFFSTGEVERTTSYGPAENVFELKDGEMVQDPE
jgi:hypothetical protein